MPRTDVSFRSGSDTCAAWLYRPDGVVVEGAAAAGESRPIIVMAHGLACVREMRLDAFADRFTAAGYLCLVFDYRYFGASTGEPCQLLDIRSQREDWRAAVVYARSVAGADPGRVILWGSSFSGGHVFAVGADDPRLAAVIAQCPFTSGLASTLAVPPMTLLKLSALGVADCVGSWIGRNPLMVESNGTPGSVALMTSEDSKSGMDALMPDGSTIRTDVAARFALDIVRSFPGRSAERIRCPLFVVVCENDTVAPAGPTKRYVAAANGEMRVTKAGHFDIYVGEEFERNVAEQLDFLARTVPTPENRAS